VGAKAAALGRARRLGFPVLAGLVVPVDCSAAALRAAREAFATGGSGAARLAAIDAPLDAALVAELRDRVAALDAPLVVRSSSPLEAAGAWAGAFTSYIGIEPEQLEIAIRGCWASAFSRDVLERSEHEGIDPTAVRLAVLIQPAVEFETAGSARAEPDGTVRIVATRGSPAGLMQGWISGEEIVVDADDRAAPGEPAILPAARAAELARLARRVREILGDDLIEWGWGSREGLLLLQSRDTRSERSAAEIVVPPPANAAESLAAIRVARIVRRFFGPFVDETVLPWALLTDRVPALESVAESERDPADALAEARAIARRHAADAWNLPEDAAIAAASRAIDALRSGVPDRELAARLQVSVSLDPALVRQLIGLLRRLERTLDRTRAPQRDRWEPFLYATASAYGERVAASAAVAGIAAGRARYVGVPSAAPPEFDRKILIVPRPLPAFGPLLWNAAGLVSIGGGAGAHLIEIARSLGVPSVLGCRLDRLIAEGAESHLLAVDGDEGVVSVLSAPLS